MGLIYVTGISGSGKSQVLRALRARGYEAYGTDEDGIAAFYDDATGEELLEPPKTADGRTPEWRARYTYRMSVNRVQELARLAAGREVFLCGVAANENEVWNFFDSVFALVIDTDTLRHRLESRTNNNFGKVPHELESILEWQANTERAYAKFGHIRIDATRSINDVVEDLVRKVAEDTR